MPAVAVRAGRKDLPMAKTHSPTPAGVGSATNGNREWWSIFSKQGR